MSIEKAATHSTRTRRRLSEAVYEQLLRLIVRGELPQDCKLPPEEALTERFGVSRPVVREALRRLNQEGYIVSHQGSGHVVVRGERPGQSIFPAIDTISNLLRSYEFRINVERATTVLASERRTDADIAEIESALSKTDAALSSGMLHLVPDLNFGFHRSVARATKNGFYVATLEMIPNFVGFTRLDLITFQGEQVTQRMHRLHAEHVSIFKGIVARDSERACREMENHISSARDFVLEHQIFDPRGLRGGLEASVAAGQALNAEVPERKHRTVNTDAERVN